MTPYIATQIFTAHHARLIADILSTMTYYGHDDDVRVLRGCALAVEDVCPHRKTYVDDNGIKRCKHCLAVIYAS